MITNPEIKEESQMAYRNNPFRQGNYTYSNINNPVLNDLSAGSIKITDEIPLPNNVESTQENENLERKHSKHSPSIIEFIKERIAIEELILIGVIIVLLIERIEDEFLILMLAYILIF